LRRFLFPVPDGKQTLASTQCYSIRSSSLFVNLVGDSCYIVDIITAYLSQRHLTTDRGSTRIDGSVLNISTVAHSSAPEDTSLDEVTSGTPEARGEVRVRFVEKVGADEELSGIKESWSTRTLDRGPVLFAGIMSRLLFILGRKSSRRSHIACICRYDPHR
jgi:hypothetical protein